MGALLSGCGKVSLRVCMECKRKGVRLTYLLLLPRPRRIDRLHEGRQLIAAIPLPLSLRSEDLKTAAIVTCTDKASEPMTSTQPKIRLSGQSV
eukprot:1639350-Amphidinium_carterae.1